MPIVVETLAWPSRLLNQDGALTLLKHDGGVEVSKVMELGPHKAHPLGEGLKGSGEGHWVQRSAQGVREYQIVVLVVSP